MSAVLTPAISVRSAQLAELSQLEFHRNVWFHNVYMSVSLLKTVQQLTKEFFSA